MKRVYMAAFAICLIGTFTVGVIIVTQPPPLSTEDLSWGVDVNDTFQYDIRAWGNTSSGSIHYLQVIPLNSTSITVTVAGLPPIGSAHNGDTFASEIIFRNKVNCVFTNGTALDEWTNVTLCEMISGCILPIGDWSTIDALFPDEPHGFTPGGEFLVTILHDDWFTIEYVWYGSIDGGGGWTGNISLSTGVPTSILWVYRHGVDSPNYIELTLV